MSKSNETLKCLITELSKVYKISCVLLVKDVSTNTVYPCVLRNGETDITVIRALGDCNIKKFDVKKTVCVSLSVNPKDV